MPELTRIQKSRCLAELGYRYVSGWVPAEVAARMDTEIKKHLPELNKVLRGLDPIKKT